MNLSTNKINSTLDELYSFIDLAKKKESWRKEDWREYKLENIKILLKKLGNPEDNFENIHVAGTKGKGSVVHYLSAILTEENISNGCFFSPHIIDERERFFHNSQKSSWQDIIPLLEKCILTSKKYDISNTVFDLFTATAFLYFKEKNVKVAIIETGLGGRLDSTNILPFEKSLATVITQIGKDHTNILGDDILKIAFEKAGIIKKKTPLFYQQQQYGKENKEIEKVFIDSFKKKNIDLDVDQFLFKIENKNINFEDDFIPSFQSFNLITSFEVLKNLNFLSDKNFGIHFFKKIFKRYPFEGRYQSFGNNILLDGAHNETSIKILIDTIKKDKQNQQFKNIDFYFYLLPEKDVESFLSPIPKEWNLYLWDIDLYYLEKKKKKEQIEKIKKYCLKLNRNLEVKDKLFKPVKKKDTLCVISGSFTLVAYFLK